MGELRKNVDRYGIGLATEEQKDHLRRLIEEDEGEVDEDWLESLTVDSASKEIRKRVFG